MSFYPRGHNCPIPFFSQRKPGLETTLLHLVSPSLVLSFFIPARLAINTVTPQEPALFLGRYGYSSRKENKLTCFRFPSAPSLSLRFLRGCSPPSHTRNQLEAAGSLSAGILAGDLPAGSTCSAAAWGTVTPGDEAQKVPIKMLMQHLEG